MKLSLVTIIVMVFCWGSLSYAQLEMPDASPRTEIKQRVGLTDFELSYSRPSVNNRIVFGDLVPYNQLWRTGANKGTTLSFNTPIIIGGEKIAAGKYGVFSKVSETHWTIILYTEHHHSGVPRDWNEEKVVLSVPVKIIKTSEKQESFAISFEHLSPHQFDLVFHWENTRIDLHIALPTRDLAQANIDKIMSGPNDRDYYLAASFYLDENKSLDLALEYIKKAVEMRGDEAFWYTRKQALIEYALGDKQAAIASAKRSLAAAKKINYEQYIKLNEASIKEWSE